MRFLVTAGNTHEMIDRVRQWSNIFTGTTGLRIAQALTALGGVTLLTSNKAHLAEIAAMGGPKLKAIGFGSHADLRALLAEQMRGAGFDAVFMAAAVADYAPAGVFSVMERKPTDVPGQEYWIVQNVQAAKIKSSHPAIAVLGRQTEKLVDLFRKEWGHRGILVKFKLEVGLDGKELIEISEASRAASGAEYLVANTLEMIEGADAGAYLLSAKGAEWVPRAGLPARMVNLVQEHGK